MLAGLRVIEVGDERGHLAGRILADLGAEVIKVEPPAGDPLRRRGPFLPNAPEGEGSIAWLSGNVAKKSVVLDLASCEGDRAAFRRLLDTADALIEAYPAGTLQRWGLDAASLQRGLCEGHPGLVHCLITPFGAQDAASMEGPDAHDLVIVAEGGNAAMTGDPEGAPQVCALPTAYFHAGPEAVIGILSALFAREELGGGQLVDVSMQECQLATTITGVGQFALGGRPGRRGGFRTGPTREIWACKDGYVSYGLRGGPARAPSLEATVACMHEHGMAPQWLREMDWASYSPFTCGEDVLQRLEEVFAAFFATRTRRELYREALSRRILLAPCNDAREILAQEQLRSRRFFEDFAYPELGATLVQPGTFATVAHGQIGHALRAPRLDEHGDEIRAALQDATPPAPLGVAEEQPLETHVGERGVFEGLRVLELGAGAAGPVATRYLAEQGATVIRIESARRPDFLRMLHVTTANRHEPDILERAPMYVLLNPNKKSVSLNMKTEEGVELVRRLVDWADVVCENFAPGVMERWGLAPEALSARKPELVMVSGCLFGQTGPQRSYPGFGGQGAAIAGFNHMTGEPDAEALGPYGTITDSLAPRFVAAAAIAALIELRRSGRGQRIDISQIETGVYCLSEMVARQSTLGESMRRLGNRSEVAAPHGIYRCRDREDAPDSVGRDQWIALAVWDEAQWSRLVEAMGAPAWCTEPRFETLARRRENTAALDAGIARHTASRDAERLVEDWRSAGIEVGLVRTFDRLLEDPRLIARDHFVRIEHDILGPLLFERSGHRLSRSPGGLRTPGPKLGEHNAEVLGDLLSLSAQEIDELIRCEVVA